MLNNVVLVGRLVKDVDLKYSPNGNAYTSFTLAVNRSFKKEGQPDADFPNVKAFGKQAENLANYMSKGSLIGITGSIQTGSYDDKDGKKVYTVDVLAQSIQFLEKKDNQQGGQQQPQQQQYNQNQQQPLNQPMYGGNPNQPQGNFHTGNGQQQQNYQWSGQQQQNNVDPFANSKGPTNQEIEESLPF